MKRKTSSFYKKFVWGKGCSSLAALLKSVYSNARERNEDITTDAESYDADD
jgi:hypothetical protein